MGWASWNSFSNTVDSAVIEHQAQAMVSTGMKAAGYQYLLIDEGWWLGDRDADGNIVVDRQQWPALAPGDKPGDMANIVRYIHKLGLKAAIYTDAGEFGCSYVGPDIGPPRMHTGSLGHYQQDFLQFARWGFDYVKVDWCGGDKANLDPAVQYAEISRALTDAERATGHHLFYSICEWGKQSPWTWAPGVGGATEDMWRTGGDIVDPIVDDAMHAMRRVGAKNILKNFDDGYHPEAQHTGYYNDLDMMVIGMHGTTDAADRMHMSLWAVAGAPLMVGPDLTKLTPAQVAVLTNAEVIAVDQDRLGLQGVKAAEPQPGLEVWSKPLAAPGERGVVLLNRSNEAAEIAFRLEDLGLDASAPAAVRDLWAHRDTASAGPSFSVRVGAGDAVMLRVRGREARWQRYTPQPGAKAETSCDECSQDTERRQYVSFAGVKARGPFAVMRILYASRGEHSVAAMMQVDGESPTRIQLVPVSSGQGMVAAEAPFVTGKASTVRFWLPEGGAPAITAIELAAP